MNIIKPKKTLQLLSFLLLPILSKGQTIKWATKVLEFSSERVGITGYGTDYRSSQVLGKPSNSNNYGQDCVCAWSPASPDAPGDEWIKVGFETPIKTNKIIIVENFNPGAIAKVLAYDTKGNEYLAFEGNPEVTKEKGRWYNISYKSGDEITAIKVVLLSSKVFGYNQIDAIGISGSEDIVKPKINHIKDLNKDLLKENLGRAINSDSGELAPIITSDGKTLFYTSSKKGRGGKIERQNIMMATMLKDGSWSTGAPLKKIVNRFDNNAAVAITADNKTLYVLNAKNQDGTISKGLSKCVRIAGGWSEPQKIEIKNYSNDATTTEFTVSQDGKVIIMSAKRNDSFGDKDLYVSFKIKNDTYSEPVNLGKLINSEMEEGQPFLAADSKTLYFGSEGHMGYGSNDIFLSKRLDSTWTNWSEPENLGMPINTANWDGYFTISAQGDFAYMSSEGGPGKQEEIFRVRVPNSVKPEPLLILSGTVTNAKTNQPIAAEIVAEYFEKKDSTLKKVLATYIPETGEYKIVLPVGKSLTLSAQMKGYLGMAEVLDFSKELKYREIKRNLKLAPIEVGLQLTLSNVIFEQGTTNMLMESYKELDRLVALMKEYPEMEILLEGHTDPQGDMIENVKLSKARVETVEMYLNKKSIASTRIQTKAWGGNKPLTNNTTEEGRRKNRRVEFKITKL